MYLKYMIFKTLEVGRRVSISDYVLEVTPRWALFEHIIFFCQFHFCSFSIQKIYLTAVFYDSALFLLVCHFE